MCVTVDGVWSGEWIYWPLTGRNYNSIVMSTLYGSLEHSLLTFPCNGSNIGCSSASGLRSSLHRLPHRTIN
jgi:hypothetical protein